ncbi:hypothetical protein ES703_87187 [subsurface metagenome]
MNIIGQHGELDSENGSGETRRIIAIEEGERIGVRVRDKRAEPVKDEEVISFFMPGTLTLSWKKK